MKKRTLHEVVESLQESLTPGVVVEAAPYDDVTELAPYVQWVLVALGFSSAWVSDLSAISDFPLDDEDYDKISQKLGFVVDPNDLLVDVARRLRARAPEQ